MRAAFLVLCLLPLSEPAFALRPYDSTDADVAKQGEFELELGPVGRQREGALDREPGEPRSAIVDNGVFIKQVLRQGTLQDASGPSVATEYGLLLPSVHGEKGTGFSVAGIVSQRTEQISVHLNAALAWTREHEPDLFLGAILEGPYSWVVRPVAEVFGEQASGNPRTASGLVGAIWRLRDGLSFDVGMRRAHDGNETIRELRLGLTWTLG